MGWSENHAERLHHTRHPLRFGEKVKHLRSKTELLQIAVLLVHVFKRGNVSLQTNSVENLQLTIEKNKMDLNFLQKEQLKGLLELETEMQEESILKSLKTLKNSAERLKQDGLTITISHKGQTILKLGYEAKPTLSQIVTWTNAIEVNNLTELIKLVK